MLFRGGLDYIISVTDDLIIDPVLTATYKCTNWSKVMPDQSNALRTKAIRLKNLKCGLLSPKWTFKEFCFWGAWHKILVSTIL